MTTWIFGAGGMLGRELVRLFPDAAARTRAALDVTDRAALERDVLPTLAPGSLLLNAAADTRVDAAESDDAHRAVNAEAPGLLGALAARTGSRVVHVSTDYVFDGTATRPYREEDPVAPANAYGRGKLEGERRLAESGAEALVVRTSWVFGHGGANFVDTILKAAEGGRRELRVVVDQVGRPTFARDLAGAIRRLLSAWDRAPWSGARVVHFANANEASWFDVARHALLMGGFSRVAVSPCSSAEFPRPAKRPSYSVLDTTRYESIVGEAPRGWREAVLEYLAERRP